MTDLARALTVEERLALLEAKLGPSPLAVVPPITVGSLANVPAPGSQIAAQWAQDASGMVVHRFASRASLDAWAAPTGALAVTVDDATLFRRKGGYWSRVTPYTDAVTGQALAILAPAGSYVQAVALTIPADTAPRQVDVNWHIRIDRFPPDTNGAHINIDGGLATEYQWARVPEVTAGSGAAVAFFASITVRNWPVATGHPVVVQGSVANLSGTTNGAVFNSVYYNRLTVSVIGS